MGIFMTRKHPFQTKGNKKSQKQDISYTLNIFRSVIICNTFSFYDKCNKSISVLSSKTSPEQIKNIPKCN